MTQIQWCGRSRRQNCESSSYWSSRKVSERGVSFRDYLLSGHNPVHDGTLGSPTCDFSRIIKWMGEIFNCYLLILSQGEVASPMIFGLVRIQGGLCPMVEPWKLMRHTCQFHLLETRSQKVIQESYYEEAVNKEKGKNYWSCMNAVHKAGSETIPFNYEWWQSELYLIVN